MQSTYFPIRFLRLPSYGIITKKSILLILIIVGAFSFSWAQPSGQVKLNPVIPPGPNAASLGKYGEVPVSLYSGLPEISIPIYEINTGRIKFPVNLSYHAGGIRVEETASWVGLGWTMTGNGAITRTMRGRPDEEVVLGGYFNTNQMFVSRILNGPDVPDPDSITWYNKQKHRVVSRLTDGEPDLFSLNAPGANCRFFFNQENNCFYTNPASKYKISYTKPDDNLIWQVVDQDGLIYSFEAREFSNAAWDSRIGTTPVVTSWFLTGIEDPQTHRTVGFEYETLPTTSFINGVSEVYLYPLPFSDEYDDYKLMYQTAEMKKVRLKRISFDGGEVIFSVQSGNRLDLPDDKALETITVKDYTGAIVKKCVLSTSYFDGGWAALGPPLGPAAPEMYRYRLRLDSVTFQGGNIADKQVYKFNYNDQMCNRVSLDQDEWGYFNQANNTHLVKDQFLNLADNHLSYIAGGNRKVNQAVNQIGMLQRITYPTGGYSDFQYETNCYSQSVTGGVYHNLEDVTVQAPFIEPDFQASPYSYTETSFVVNGPGDCGGDAGIAWGEVLNLDQNAEFCPSHIRTVNCYVQGTDPGNQLVKYYLSGSIHPFALPPGNYKLVAEFIDCNWDYFMDARVVLHLKDCITQYIPGGVVNHYVGGLRIKSITNHDPVSGNENKKTYDYTFGNGFSSGVAPSKPEFDYLVAIETSYSVNLYYKTQSYSCIPLATTKGGVIGYGTVTENIWNNNSLSGFTKYEYTTALGYPDLNEYGNEIPMQPLVNRDYMRGLLLSKAEFGIANGIQYPIHTVTNEYKTIQDTTAHTSSMGFIGGALSGAFAFTQPVISESVDLEGLSTYAPIIGKYREFSDKILLEKTTEETFDKQDPLKLTSLVKEYTYSPFNYEVNSVTSYLLNNDVDKNISHIKYPFDYFAGGGTVQDNNMLALYNLVQANNLNVPIENSEFKSTAGGNKLVSSRASTFNNITLLPYQVDQAELAQPLAIGGTTANVNGNFVKDASLKQALSIPSYDNYGNVLSQKLSNDVEHVYLWNYKSMYAVAEVTNAARSEIAYTSFEGDDKGGWVYSGQSQVVSSSPTGGLCYDLGQSNGALSSPALNNSKKYVISYWSTNNSPLQIVGTINNAPEQGKTINGWTFFKHVVDGQNGIVLTGTGFIDEVRLYPVGAQMTTLVYKPLVGVISQCDVNNRITYYDYDGLSRLIRIKDEDRKVLKRICYSYNNQPEPCRVYYNVRKEQGFVKNDCTTGYTGSSYLYVVPEHSFAALTQSEADALADADITQNGQLKANQYGTCLASATYSSEGISDYFYSTACSSTQRSEPYFVSVPAGTFTSSVSQADANTLAVTYAQQQANLNGACTDVVDIYFSTYISYGADAFFIKLANTSSAEVFEFNSFYGEGVVATVPVGNYDIYIIPMGFSGTFYTSAACSVFGNWGTEFYNIPFGQGCNTINISTGE